MSSALSFECTERDSPLMVKYQEGLRESLRRILDEQYPDGHINFEVRPNPSSFSVSSSGKGRGYLQVHFCAPKNISDAILQCCGFSLDSPAITSLVVWILRVAFPFFFSHSVAC